MKVFIYAYVDGQVIHGLAYDESKKEFIISNPHGTFNAKGRFTVKFSRDYLDKLGTEEFCVGLNKAGAVDPVILFKFKGGRSEDVTAILHLSLFKKEKGALDLPEVLKMVVAE